jgi:hypothetical protein
MTSVPKFGRNCAAQILEASFVENLQVPMAPQLAAILPLPIRKHWNPYQVCPLEILSKRRPRNRSCGSDRSISTTHKADSKPTPDKSLSDIGGDFVKAGNTTVPGACIFVRVARSRVAEPFPYKFIGPLLVFYRRT